MNCAHISCEAKNDVFEKDFFQRQCESWQLFPAEWLSWNKDYKTSAERTKEKPIHIRLNLSKTSKEEEPSTRYSQGEKK